jgi:hypothetical protein
VAESQADITLVTGTPQQGLPGERIGYSVGTGVHESSFLITPTGEAGLVANQLVSPTPGAKLDPIP